MLYTDFWDPKTRGIDEMINRFKDTYGKSTGAQSLYDHVMSSCEIALLILDKFGRGYSKEKIDALVFSCFTHDIGKLDPDFQAMLEAVISGSLCHPKG